MQALEREPSDMAAHAERVRTGGGISGGSLGGVMRAF